MAVSTGGLVQRGVYTCLMVIVFTTLYLYLFNGNCIYNQRLRLNVWRYGTGPNLTLLNVMCIVRMAVRV